MRKSVKRASAHTERRTLALRRCARTASMSLLALLAFSSAASTASTLLMSVAARSRLHTCRWSWPLRSSASLEVGSISSALSKFFIAALMPPAM